MSVSSGYSSIKYQNPEDCFICTEQSDTLLIHGGGETHPVCQNCVKR
jgi:hypothetical protein